MQRVFWRNTLIILFLWGLFSTHTSDAEQPVSNREDRRIPQSPQVQIDQYTAKKEKSIIELQQFRETTSIAIQNNGGQKGKATLINLNPTINAWFLLTLERERGKGGVTYHLENRTPASQQLLLDAQYPSGLVIVSEGKRSSCDRVWWAWRNCCDSQTP